VVTKSGLTRLNQKGTLLVIEFLGLSFFLFFILWNMNEKFFFSKTSNWFDPKTFMNQVSDAGSDESLYIILVKSYYQ